MPFKFILISNFMYFVYTFWALLIKSLQKFTINFTEKFDLFLEFRYKFFIFWQKIYKNILKLFNFYKKMQKWLLIFSLHCGV